MIFSVPVFRPVLILIFIGILLALPGCKRVTERMEITESREISQYAPQSRADVPTAQRFYGSDPESEQQPQQRLPLVWDTPEGWKEVPADAASGMAGMRLINLAFGPNGEGECYLSAMPGAAGGLGANINRWRA